MTYVPTPPLERAKALQRWLAEEPEAAAHVIDASLALYALHGGLREPSPVEFFPNPPEQHAPK